MLSSFNFNFVSKKRLKKLTLARDPWLCLVLTCFVIFAWASWGKVQFPLIDVGREVEIPARLLTDQLLYRDIETYYGPLAYYANALALKLFGHHLEVLLTIGIVMALVATILVYRLAQHLTNTSWAALCTICFVMYCALGPGLYNFMLPYSYGGVYATVLCLLAITCLKYYSQNEQLRWLVLAGIFSGLSGIAKQEYGVAVLGGILVSLTFYSTQSLGVRIRNCFLVVISAILSALLPLAWLAHYISWGTLLASLFPIAKANVLRQAPMFQNTPVNALLNSWISFKIFIVSSFIILGTVISVRLVITKSKLKGIYSTWNKNIIELIIDLATSQILLMLLSRFAIRSDPTSVFYPLRELGWFTWVLIGYVIVYGVTQRRERHTPTFWATLFFALILNARWSFYVKFYGLYALPVILIFFTLAYHVFQNSPKVIWRYLLICLLISVIPQINELNAYHYTVSSQHGIFYTSNKKLSDALNETIKVVDALNTSSVLVLPEGNIINFLTTTHSPSKEITFLPHTLPTEEDQKIFLNHMKADPPSAIVYVDISFHLWGYKNYAQFSPLVYQWITQNHKLIRSLPTSEGTIQVYTQSDE
jgi:4-amino-4-deoxy-L-arabinose transferase-like glycosyltransferase